MTIEAHLQSIDASLQTIAIALTAIAEGAGAAPVIATATKEKPAAAAGKGKGKGTTQQKPAQASKPSEKDGDSEGPKIADVRKALAELQKRLTPKDARSVLEDKGGVTTLSKLEEDKYQDVIDAANEKE